MISGKQIHYYSRLSAVYNKSGGLIPRSFFTIKCFFFSSSTIYSKVRLAASDMALKDNVGPLLILINFPGIKFKVITELPGDDGDHSEDLDTQIIRKGDKGQSGHQKHSYTKTKGKKYDMAAG